MSSSKGDSAGSGYSRSRSSLAHASVKGVVTGTDKENLTTDLSAIQSHKESSRRNTGRDKKLRSKSLGPGGLDALQNSSGNRRKFSTAFPLKSILKPTIPVSPVRHIPSFQETRKRTPARGIEKESLDSGELTDAARDNGLLIDFSTSPSVPVVGTDNLANPFDGFNPSSLLRDGKVALRTEEQQTAAREREQRVQREREKQAILDQRAARRKSMANRRVSFAPEATLHTWNVVELAEDSTSSSASTNSTRRTSSIAANQTEQLPAPSMQATDYCQPPSTPEQSRETYAEESPASQRDLHQTKNRRSSRQTPFNLRSVDNAEVLSSSPYSDGSVGGSEDIGGATLASVNEENLSDSDDSAVMSMEDATERSLGSAHSDVSSANSTTRLDRSLHRAAQTAGTRGIEYDENGDLSMEFTNEEITGLFQPWIKKGSGKPDLAIDELSSRHDQENINPLGLPLPKYHSRSEAGTQDGEKEDGDLSMDMTNAVGGILPLQRAEASPAEHRTIAEDYRRESITRRMSARAVSNHGDQTMEFTNVIGGIAQPPPPSHDISRDSEADEDEEMTMEFTSAFGGVLYNGRNDYRGENSKKYEPQPEQGGIYGTERFGSEEGEDGMDMTGVVGRILPPIEERTEPLDDETVGMDITNAIGTIFPSHVASSNQVHPRAPVELEIDTDQPISSPFQEHVPPSPKVAVTQQVAVVASENGSQSPAKVRARPNGRSADSRLSSKASSDQSTPVKRITTPSKQLTPRAVQSSAAAKTPPSGSIAFRSGSPKKLFMPEPQAESVKKSPIPSILFHQDGLTSRPTPTIVLRPRKRAATGFGIDKEGLGSPRMAAILDRRRSIGDECENFVPQGQASRGVRFDDPRKLREEFDNELEEREHNNQLGLTGKLDQQVERDTTLNLKELILSLTPQRNKLKGRKSLHVGTAVGILGKRPIELDQDDEEDFTPKRLKGRDASPVKSIKLPAPPSKTETVRRTTRSSMRNSPGLSPLKGASINPKEPRQFMDAESPSNKAFGQGSVLDSGTTNRNPSEDADHLHIEPIQLQEFLDMTNIHFMELTTTKRRHTLVHGSRRKRTSNALVEDGLGTAVSFEDRVAAGFCTVPMLELYQHSCRELKSYISEGRSIIRSIEAETYVDNPPLFQEYVTAKPDVRLLMDNQFRNVKSHSRLLSKSMWYEWRMKLLEGLKQGLNRHVDEMKSDNAAISKQEELLDRVVPGLVEKHLTVKAKAHNLQQVVEEMQNCNQEELRNARERLASVDREIAVKKKLLSEMQEDLRNRQSMIEAAGELKADFLQQIRDAERIREACRGWSVKEVNALKASVHALERQTHWSIISATPNPNSTYGPALTIRYRNELHLNFQPGAFRVPHSALAVPDSRSAQGRKATPLTLTYLPDHSQGPASTSRAPAPEKALILHALRTWLSHISQASLSPKHFLRSVSRAWDIAIALSNEIRMLGFCGVTRAKTLSVKNSAPAALKIRCILLGRSRIKDSRNRTAGDKPRTRIDIDLVVKLRPMSNGMSTTDIDVDIDVDVSASKVYGFANDEQSAHISETQIADLLVTAIYGKNGLRRELGNGVWRDAVRKVEKMLLS